MSSSSALTMLSSATDDEELAFRVLASWATAALARCIGVEGRSGATAGRAGETGIAAGGAAAALEEAAGGGAADEEAAEERAASASGDTGRADCTVGMPSTTASTPSTSLRA